MKIYNCRWALLGVLLLGVAGLAQADTLTGVLPTTPGGTNYQAYYDSATNLTWLANADANGPMTWFAANTWASKLNIGGVTGWTLPTTTQPDSSCSSNSGGISFGYNCTGSQMGNLFYNALGGTAGNAITGATTHNSNYNLFSNVQPGSYWSATAYAPDPFIAWGFDFYFGFQFSGNKTVSQYAWAVHSGNVGAPVSAPEPGALALMLAGLALLGLAARRRLALR